MANNLEKSVGGIQTIIWGGYLGVSHEGFLASLSDYQRQLKDYIETELTKRDLTNKRMCFKDQSVVYLIRPF